MAQSLSNLDSRIDVYESQYAFSGFVWSTYANNGAVANVKVPGTKVNVPASGDRRLIYDIPVFGCHCGGGGGADNVYLYLYLKDETAGTAVTNANTTTLTGVRGVVATGSQSISYVGLAGKTYQLYMYVSVASDDHCVAYCNGGILWVLPSTATTAPTTGYLYY